MTAYGPAYFANEMSVVHQNIHNENPTINSPNVVVEASHQTKVKASQVTNRSTHTVIHAAHVHQTVTNAAHDDLSSYQHIISEFVRIIYL